MKNNNVFWGILEPFVKGQRSVVIFDQIRWIPAETDSIKSTPEPGAGLQPEGEGGLRRCLGKSSDQVHSGSATMNQKRLQVRNPRNLEQKKVVPKIPCPYSVT
jgi:hypothetical protein